MTKEGEFQFCEIRRDEYPEVKDWVRDNLNYELPAWDPSSQLAPPTIPRGIVNGFEVQCENYRTYRILWVQEHGQERGYEINQHSEEAREGAGQCQKNELDCQDDENLDFMPCQGNEYGLREDGKPCGFWVCTDCAEHE